MVIYLGWTISETDADSDHEIVVLKSQKSFLNETNACRDGILKNQQNKTPQYCHTIPTSCAILPTMPVFVSCVHGRVVEGSVGWVVLGV